MLENQQFYFKRTLNLKQYTDIMHSNKGQKRKTKKQCMLVWNQNHLVSNMHEGNMHGGQLSYTLVYMETQRG